MSIKFCPECGSWILHGSFKCKRCGRFVLDIDRPTFLNFIKHLLQEERSLENFRALKDRVPGGVVNVSFDLATIECKFPGFEEGDIISYVNGIG
ncbi:MAG: hypothetical protein QXY75_05890 [Candidatus Bathyarchaeia archaeon]